MVLLLLANNPLELPGLLLKEPDNISLLFAILLDPVLGGRGIIENHKHVYLQLLLVITVLRN